MPEIEVLVQDGSISILQAKIIRAKRGGQTFYASKQTLDPEEKAMRDKIAVDIYHKKKAVMEKDQAIKETVLAVTDLGYFITENILEHLI